MKKLLFVIATIISVSSFSQTINSSKSKVDFKIGSMGFSSVKGTISGMKGDINFDKNNLSNSSFKVTINPNTIDTDNEKRDEHLKNEDFFDVTKYVTVSFSSSEIIKKGNDYLTKGKLTIFGITKSVEIPFSTTSNSGSTTFVGEIEVNRFDYNLGAKEYDGTFMVGETAEVTITCVVE